MKRTIALVALIALGLAAPAYALYKVTEHGEWPKSWPAELEPLRKQSRTLVGPLELLQHHGIRFAKREAFEKAWPYLLKVKSQGAPIVLRRGPSFWLGDESSAGVCIHTPPEGKAPLDATKAGGNWEQTVYIELIVDGKIVDLNRIRIPADTPIIDQRFPGEPDKAAEPARPSAVEQKRPDLGGADG